MENLTITILIALAAIISSVSINYILVKGSFKRKSEALPLASENLTADIAAAIEAPPINEAAFNFNSNNIDVLTQLPNRKYLTDYVQYIVTSKANSQVKYALFIVNLDFFRSVNNNLGHEIGDKILVECSSRIKALFSDDCVVARMDGDEFGIILQIHDNSEIDKTAKTILSAMKHPIIIFNQEVYLSVSIGISIYPDQSCCSNELIRNAAIAVNAAKNTNRNSYKIYSPDITKYSHHKFIMHSELHQAIKRNEFVLHYQPKIESKTSKVVGIEALIRWNHPTRGLLYPIDFIPIAEETGVIKYIDEWVLNAACTQLQRWMQGGLTNLRLAVNLSAWQFKDHHLVDTVAEVLKRTGITPQHLELEITETVAIENMNFTQSALGKLIEMGISISIDDFGTGYSSLSYLKHFPINFLKIDRSFVADILEDRNTYSIIKAIIEVAHALKLKVIAEGVESQAQLEMLNELGCDEIQGFHISKPMNVEDIERQMRAIGVN